ncbi:hypothetical protein [uncultured Arcobacter sp.]|uniref:hypothetical protein n=1 Tax=uncultured Arcobacter sp. TaxID=165434 RepID=UPI00261CD50E|nr:hypothetical protein [uncultured Arcobacter sp.]
MIEEVFIKAFITRIANATMDIIMGKKKDESENNSSIDESQVQVLIKQKIEEEFKNLQEDKQEIQLLDAVRSSFVHRIHNLFKQYSIRLEEVPIFLKEFNITHKDVLYEESLLEKFDDNVISFIANTLDINKDWIYGRQDYMLSTQQHGYYKNSTFFYKNLIKTNPSAVYIFTSRVPNKSFDEENDGNSIRIIVEYTKLNLNGRNIKSYTVYDDTCRYGYWRCRYELKRFILGFKKDNILFDYIRGRVLPNLYTKIEMFAEGKVNFRYLINESKQWHPEDYVFFPKDSSCYIEDELDELQKIVDEYDSMNSY